MKLPAKTNVEVATNACINIFHNAANLTSFNKTYANVAAGV